MPGSDRLFSVLLITDRRAVPAGTSLLSQIQRALEGAPSGLAILLRDKDLPFAERATLGAPLRRAAAEAGVSLAPCVVADACPGVQSAGEQAKDVEGPGAGGT